LKAFQDGKVIDERKNSPYGRGFFKTEEELEKIA
jgi:hypothetical protein